MSIACGGPKPPDSCFVPYRTDIPIEQCVQGPEGRQVSIPGKTDAERAYALSLCEAPCVVAEFLDITNSSSSLKDMPILPKFRQVSGITISMFDQSRTLEGMPRIERPSLGGAAFFVASDALQSFEGLPDDMIDELELVRPEGLTSFAGLENQPSLKRIETSDTRFTSLRGLRGLGSAPKLESVIMLNDTGLTDLTGLTGIQGRFSLSIQYSKLRSLAGAGDDLKLSDVAFRLNFELPQCEAEEFARRRGLRTDGILDNKPCP
jgi:hypothetical protein